ncbi:MAG TPA: hypothetical protein IAC62_12930 [Candidatus Pelethocola excrementipullorum]|nr:hypothetical protein [Candidatus Pelethocola excrementipullorum]
MDRKELTQIQIEQLVEDVVKELKEKLNKTVCTIEKHTESSFQKCALVMGQLGQDEEKRVTDVCQTVRTVDDVGWNMIIVADLSLGQMAQIALGLPVDSESENILQSLLEGKKVYILESGLEYRKYRESAYKTLYQIYLGYEDRIRKFGGEVVTDVQEIIERESAISTEREISGVTTGDDLDLTELGLLRESDLTKVRGNGYGTVVIGQSTIVTPLAQDYLTNHNLAVRRQ